MESPLCLIGVRIVKAYSMLKHKLSAPIPLDSRQAHSFLKELTNYILFALGACHP